MNQRGGNTDNSPTPAPNHKAQVVVRVSDELEFREKAESPKEGSKQRAQQGRSGVMSLQQESKDKRQVSGLKKTHNSKLLAKVLKETVRRETTIIETEATTLGNLAIVGGRLDSLRRGSTRLEPPLQSEITETLLQRNAKRATLVIVAPDGREVLRIERE